MPAMPQQAIDALSKVTAGANVAAARKTVGMARRTQPADSWRVIPVFEMRGRLFRSLPRFVERALTSGIRGAVQRMVLRFIAAGRLSGRFRRSGSLCAASRGDGGGEPAGRVRFSCLFVRKVSRTTCGQYPERFRVGLLSASPSNGGPYSSFFFLVYPHVLLDAPQPALRARALPPKRRRNSSSLIASHSRSEIVSGSNRDRNAASGAWGLFGCGDSRLWQRSQPKIQPSRSGKALSPPFRSYGRRCSGSCRSPWARRWLPRRAPVQTVPAAAHRAPANGHRIGRTAG